MINQIQTLHAMGISACSLDFSCSKAITFQYDSGESEGDPDYSEIMTNAPHFRNTWREIFPYLCTFWGTAQGERLLKQLEKKGNACMNSYWWSPQYNWIVRYSSCKKLAFTNEFGWPYKQTIMETNWQNRFQMCLSELNFLFNVWGALAVPAIRVTFITML